MNDSTTSVARVDDDVIARRVADTARLEIADFEQQADAHYMRCRVCRGGDPCTSWDWYWTVIVDIQRRLRHALLIDADIERLRREWISYSYPLGAHLATHERARRRDDCAECVVLIELEDAAFRAYEGACRE